MNEWLLTVLSEIEMLKRVRTINAINTYRERGYTLISLIELLTFDMIELRANCIFWLIKNMHSKMKDFTDFLVDNQWRTETDSIEGFLSS